MSKRKYKKRDNGGGPDRPGQLISFSGWLKSLTPEQALAVLTPCPVCGRMQHGGDCDQ